MTALNYTILQNKRMRRCGVAPPPPPTNNSRKTQVTPTNYISSEREFIGESESSKILGKYIIYKHIIYHFEAGDLEIPNI